MSATNYMNPTDSATMVLMLDCGWSLPCISSHFGIPTIEVIILIRAETRRDHHPLR